MDKYQQLENRIKELENWKLEKTSQQIKFPLDIKSIDALQKHFLSVIDFSLFNTSVSGQEFRSLLVKQDGKTNLISVANAFITFSVNIATDYITLGTDLTTGNPGELSDDTFVTVYNPGTPPGGLDNAGGYFVINSTGPTCQLSLTSGGAAVDITSLGIGTHYISY